MLLTITRFDPATGILSVSRMFRRFGVGVRTVDRIWDDREKIFEQAETGKAVRELAERIGQLRRAVNPAGPPKSMG